MQTLFLAITAISKITRIEAPKAVQVEWEACQLYLGCCQDTLDTRENIKAVRNKMQTMYMTKVHEHDAVTA